MNAEVEQDPLAGFTVTSQEEVLSRGLAALAREPFLDPVQWMEKYFTLVGQSSGIAGPWKTFAYQRALIFAFDDDRTNFINVQKSTRLGYTKMISGAALRFNTYRKRNVLFYQPSDQDAKDFEKDEIGPAIDASEYIRSHLRAGNSEKRTASNTTLRKEFNPAVLHLLGGESPKNYRRLTAHCVIGDEIDDFPDNVGRSKDKKQGSPIRLMARALTDSPFKKQIVGSSPTTEFGSLVYRQTQKLIGRVFERFFPCMECGHMQPLRWGGAKGSKGGIKFINNDPETARYMCRDCGCLMEYYSLEEMDTGGEWRSDLLAIRDEDGEYCALDDLDRQNPVEPPRRMGFKLNSLYSPFLSWRELVETFLEAKLLSIKGDNTEFVTFTNHLLGDVWREKLDEVIDPGDFQLERTIKYKAQVPDTVVFLTAGVDIQKDHAHIDIVGWAPRRINFGIQYHRYRGIERLGDLDEKSFWDGLHNLLSEEFRTESGAVMPITVCCIDSGHRAQDVYKFCRRNPIKYVPVKGAPVAKVQREIKFPPKRNGDGVFLTWTGGDAITNIIREWYSKKIEPSHLPSGYSFWPEGRGYDAEYFTQLLASQRILKGTLWSWEPPNENPNDSEDARKYAYAAMMIAVHEYRKNLDPTEKEIKHIASQTTESVYDQIRKLAQKVNG